MTDKETELIEQFIKYCFIEGNNKKTKFDLLIQLKQFKELNEVAEYIVNEGF